MAYQGQTDDAGIVEALLTPKPLTLHRDVQRLHQQQDARSMVSANFHGSKDRQDFPMHYSKIFCQHMDGLDIISILMRKPGQWIYTTFTTVSFTQRSPARRPPADCRPVHWRDCPRFVPSRHTPSSAKCRSPARTLYPGRIHLHRVVAKYCTCS